MREHALVIYVLDTCHIYLSVYFSQLFDNTKAGEVYSQGVGYTLCIFYGEFTIYHLYLFICLPP